VLGDEFIGQRVIEIGSAHRGSLTEWLPLKRQFDTNMSAL
jgi:hypothetical protein